MNQVNLVGLSHVDQNAEQRLRNAFEQLKPNVMTIEYPADQLGYIDFWNSPECIKRRKAFELEVGREAFDPSTNKPLMNVSYASEIEIMGKIFEETGVPLYCVDDLRTTIKNIMNPNLTKELTWLMDYEEDKDDINFLYSVFEEHFQGKRANKQILKLLSNSKQTKVLSRERETFQRDRIREVLDSSPNESTQLMHVAGIAHLADAKGHTTLYSLLKKTLPKHSFQVNRFSLSQFD